MSGITVSRRSDALLAIKVGLGDDADRRRREADLLARIDHPGVVQLIDVVDPDTDDPGADGPVEIHLAYVGTDTWRSSPPTTSASLIEGLAVVASTVVDLHDLGIAHRALLAEHIVLGADRRPVICGLADATARADDVDALGRLITTLAVGAVPEVRADLDAIASRAGSGELSAHQLTTELNRLRAPAARGTVGGREGSAPACRRPRRRGAPCCRGAAERRIRVVRNRCR